VREPGRAAIGTWGGGRFLRFGEAVAEERLEALLRPGGGIDTLLTADAYRPTGCWGGRWRTFRATTIA
jgi:hypothetical protein